jgi:lysozyme family protein
MIDKDAALKGWLEREGAVYTDRADDRGGPTKFGLTLRLLRDHLKDQMIPASRLQAMEWAEAREIIWRVFAVESGFAEIQNPVLFEVVWDAAGNHGAGRAIQWLQAALGVKVDGIFGSQTRAALPYLNATKLALFFQCARERFYSLIASRNKEDNDHDGIPDALENLPGWINRSVGITEKIARSL